MNVFLIRHGQTLLNQSNTHQYTNTPLSEKGLLQAKSIAQRLIHAEIDIIYSSPILRAKQTAEAIAEQTGKPLVFLDGLVEIKQPSEVEGKSRANEEVRKIKMEIFDNYADKNWHHSDEENFWDVRTRIQQVMTKLEAEKHNDILVVSHGYAIKMFVSLCIFRENLTAEAFLQFYENTAFSNTGITKCEFRAEKGWQVITMNDTTHLD